MWWSSYFSERINSYKSQRRIIEKIARSRCWLNENASLFSRTRCINPPQTSQPIFCTLSRFLTLFLFSHLQTQRFLVIFFETCLDLNFCFNLKLSSLFSLVSQIPSFLLVIQKRKNLFIFIYIYIKSLFINMLFF